ncbi:hypothetical protein N0V84_008664 [Fusarium piperis]|uniref:Uncharacterized protein n=1 Tax=Fusarium piperis TaxID=1435070 RepID=A0A9W8W7T6_9HYPO|nr:hypothetical protein N0V84_008664 [Fusarium piperis]
MPKVRTTRRAAAHRRSTRHSSARPNASRQQSESPEQRELREDHERLRPLEEANAVMVQNPQVGSFTDSLMSPSHLDGMGMDFFPEDHLQFPSGDLALANLNNGGPVGGSSMPPVTSLHYHGSQTSVTTTTAPAMPSWASPQPALLGFSFSIGRTAGEIAFQLYGTDIRIDTALCKRLAAELALREPIQRRPDTKLNMERRSNVESFLGYLTGVPVTRACKNCTKGHGPWHECVILEGQLCGSCTNCWFNASGSRCTFHGKLSHYLRSSLVFESILTWYILSESNQANATYAPSPAWNTASSSMAVAPNMLQAPALAQSTSSLPQASPGQQSSSLPQASPLPQASFTQQSSSWPQALSLSQANSSFTNALQPAHQPSTPQPSPPAYSLPSRLDPSN